MSTHKETTGRGMHEPGAFKVTNSTGSTLTKGTVIKRDGYNTTIEAAISTDPVNDDRLGIVLDDILDGAIGYVANRGDFGQFDTSSFTVEDILYSTVGGALSVAVLGAPIATVIKVDATDGHVLAYVPLS